MIAVVDVYKEMIEFTYFTMVNPARGDLGLLDSTSNLRFSFVIILK